MIVAAFFGMATKFSEGLLAIKYRVVDKDGHSLGGRSTILNREWGRNGNGLQRFLPFLESV